MILSKENLKLLSDGVIKIPAANSFELPEKVLQFGTGVLLRGLPDYFIDKANRQGIFNGRVVVVKSTGNNTEEFDQQDSLYTLCVRGIEEGIPVSENIISSAISRVIAANQHWEEVLDIAGSEALQLIVSNTTEAGIELVKERIDQAPPLSFPAKVLAVLYRRYQVFKAAQNSGLVIIATELIPDNGRKLGQIVLELARFNELEEQFVSWLQAHNRFCNSLVDRIVPGKPDETVLGALEEELGYTDQLLSMTEPYRLWAIEGDEKVAEILSFAKADPGVVIAEDIEIYRELKVRLLNGTHILSSGIAFLSGIDSVKNAMKNEQLKTYIDVLMAAEIAPAIPYPVTEAQTTAFANTVKDRFANPSIEHLWLNITFQYTMKMKIRILPLLLNHYQLFRNVPENIAFGFAAYLMFMKADLQKDGKYYGTYQNASYLINDEQAAYFADKIILDPENYVQNILSDTGFWGTDLTALTGFIPAVKNKFEHIEKEGMAMALAGLGKRSKPQVLKIHPNDNVLVALCDLKAGEKVAYQNTSYLLLENVQAKHKFYMTDMSAGDEVLMYGTLVGKVQYPLQAGALMTTDNLKHAAAPYQYRPCNYSWTAPDVSKFEGRTFNGYHRADGRVGTANYWLFIPTVFCENRNLDVIRETLHNELGYAVTAKYKTYAQELVAAFKNGTDISSLTAPASFEERRNERPFKNIDGIKFLNHQVGCGGIRQDAAVLSKLLAAYADHPNVAGVTVLSLGCQNLQVQDFRNDLKERNPDFDKPMYIFEQQQSQSEEHMIAEAIRKTFEGLVEVNKFERSPAPLSKLNIGVKCGGSDGFSGISANPAVGYTSDLLVALGGTVLLAEFPELCGAEQNLIDRTKDEAAAKKFIHLMSAYSEAAENAGSGFHMNPSPGNIKDGLITDAMKSNGAAKKGGTSPVEEVLDYTEPATKSGLNLVCTPGNDVEATTGKAASGATLILFTTGLGTPTGNPVCPVIKVATNNALTKRMGDIIDINTGPVIEGEKTIEEMGADILEYCIRAASGEVIPKSVLLNQDDFIPWKRGVSL